ncbi:MAG: hypothetical protein K1W06_06595 [Lachnospiraceae bacterium]
MKRVEALEYGEDWALIIYEAVDKNNMPEQIPQSSIKQMFSTTDSLYITPLALEIGLENYLGCKTNVSQAVKFLYKQQLLHTDNSNALTVKKSGTRYYAIKLNSLKCYCYQKYHVNSKHNNP